MENKIRKDLNRSKQAKFLIMLLTMLLLISGCTNQIDTSAIEPIESSNNSPQNDFNVGSSSDTDKMISQENEPENENNEDITCPKDIKIVPLAAGVNHIVGLRDDGTVIAAGENAWGRCDVSGWRNIVALVLC